MGRGGEEIGSNGVTYVVYVSEHEEEDHELGRSVGLDGPDLAGSDQARFGSPFSFLFFSFSFSVFNYLNHFSIEF